ncbi:protein singed wings 2 isoform X2 [Melanaphis sacchari]|uniref:protein singed wings 2 isoform X2 n=1 Tax=Melanaphis sacchari TaxID=742174 RepID=UPI000DC13806|nr:protein singed wings 2 isoform X2 [Melanaphis sacchari]
MDAFHLIALTFVTVLSLYRVVSAGTKLGELCASSTAQNKCMSANKTDGYRVACSGGFREDYSVEDYFLFQMLTLCHWPLDHFDPGVSLRPYPKLVKLTITKSKIKDITSEFPEFLHNLKTLNLSHLNLERVKYSTFKYLTSLEVLDLSYNKLNHLYSPTTEYLPKLKQIWLAGEFWFCKNDLFWLLLLQVSKDPSTFKVMDSNRMTCGGYKYIGKPVIPVLRLLSDLEKECPSSPPDYCVCTLDNVVRGRGASFYLHPVITVDCSYRGLKMLPKILPHNTTTLLVQGNQVPTYALDNAFQRNRNIAQLYLGANPWRCNCLFAPAFQDFLIKYKSLIMDLSDIKCSYQQNDEYYLTPIHDLPRNTLCRNSTTDMVNFWDSLNVLLASLIVVIILKFIYDYIMYKKYGRIPRIITLLP